MDVGQSNTVEPLTDYDNYNPNTTQSTDHNSTEGTPKIMGSQT